MRRGRRFGLSAEQKCEVWRRWKAGQTRQGLRWARKDYKREMEARGLRLPKSRRRFADYVLHLRVWDLKKEGKSNTEIARLIFPKLSVHSARSKVRDHLKAAKKLISGHYREIG